MGNIYVVLKPHTFSISAGQIVVRGCSQVVYLGNNGTFKGWDFDANIDRFGGTFRELYPTERIVIEESK